MLGEILTSISPTSWCVTLALLLLLVWCIRSPSHPNLPPTPGLALPVVGHIHLLPDDPRGKFQEWRKQLGDVFSLRLGPRTVVVLSGYDTIRQALVKQADLFSDRPSHVFVLKKFPHIQDGIIDSSGSSWKAQRTTSLNILRNFGMGKNILAKKISEEVDIFIKKLHEANGKPQDLKKLASISVSNVICAIIFGQRFDYDDPKFVKMMTLISRIIQLSGGVSILDSFPCLENIPFDPFKSKDLVATWAEYLAFVNEIIDEKKKRYDPSNLDNFIVAYIDEVNKAERTGVRTEIAESKLQSVIGDLFAAGTETTSTTLLWCILYCLHYPQVQKKIYQEIVREVGTERPPNMLDKSKLKYLNATIMEIQRLSSIVPLSLHHSCIQDTTIKGFHIPEGATIIPNLDSILRSKKLWGDPEVFRPERFLDEEGNLVKREELVPFSMGRRLCLGESLAKMELFLYLSSLFQCYEFLPADPQNLPPLKSTWGVTCPPEPYQVRCVIRKIYQLD